jgi:hypothetical protein
MISPGRRGGRSRARCSAGLTLRTSSRELALFISFIATIAAFDRDRSGNIAIILAPAVIVVLGFVGVAVDYDAPIPATRSTSASSSATVTTGAGDPIGHDVIEVVTGLHTLDEEVRVSVGVSVGIAMSPEHGNEAETLLLAIADGARYEAKSSGKWCCRMASMDSNLAALRRITDAGTRFTWLRTAA